MQLLAKISSIHDKYELAIRGVLGLGILVVAFYTISGALVIWNDATAVGFVIAAGAALLGLGQVSFRRFDYKPQFYLVWGYSVVVPFIAACFLAFVPGASIALTTLFAVIFIATFQFIELVTCNVPAVWN
ncbi:hypothetical protein [Clavibacter michiganensis]|uniref:hypothetical protein n=1 Tax=Clavibacter michiganensis TaxID=28447 RepID=UPI001186DDA1|nr:hypothetical protein [Clavibacter michiganensis]